MSEIIINQEIIEELKKSFLDYSMSVITDRALPDVRSGLKPVHTRILYSAFQLGMLSNKPFKKSARLVGHTLGLFHPHGDSSVYQAIVKLVQPFSMRYPLIEGEGSWGSQDGDPAAAQRYTLCRLSPYGELMLEGIKNNIVDFKDNFSNDELEPTVLPSLLPNLLVNGSSGIAVGMATKLAPHNLTEVCDALCYYISKGANINNVTLSEILNFIQGPDFPTGCKIINKNSLYEFYDCGKGTIKIQGKYRIEPIKNSKHYNIIFYEIPFNVSKEKLITKISNLCSENILTNITDVRDETTNKNGIRFIIETSLTSEEEILFLIQQLFKNTELETSFSINQNVLVNGAPKLLNLLELIDYYVKFQQEILLREYKNEYDKLSIQKEKLEGLLIAIEDIDNIIQHIKQSENRQIAKEKLVSIYKFTEIQVEAILNMRLSKLTKVDSVQVNNNLDKIIERLNLLYSFIHDINLLNNQLIERITNIKNKYGDERRTEIVNEITEVGNRKIQIIEEDTKVIITKKNEVKRIKTDKKITSYNFSILTTTISTLFLFSNKGKCYKLAVSKIPLVFKISDQGLKLNELLNLDLNEKIIYVLDTAAMTKELYIISKKGYIKKIDLKECRSNRTIKYANLKENDEILYCSISDLTNTKVTTNYTERVLKDFNLGKRTSYGNRSPKWQDDEFIEKI